MTEEWSRCSGRCAEKKKRRKRRKKSDGVLRAHGDVSAPALHRSKH